VSGPPPRSTASAQRLLFSVDLEEFDAAPPRHGGVDLAERLRTSRVGLERLLEAIDPLQLRVTFFTTVVFATHHAALLRELATHHEISSHGVRHERVERADIAESRRRLEDLLGVPIRGFRMPRMGRVDLDAIAEAGYAYDASLHPTWIPGRYNHLRAPRRPFLAGDLLRVPASVSPRLRMPLFWLAIKHLPQRVLHRIALRTLHHDGDLNFYVHPWEFTDLESFQASRLLRGGGGTAMLRRTVGLLSALAAEAQPATYAEMVPAWRTQAARS